jgi:hypothetical protein
MIVYAATRSTFMEDADSDALIDNICEGFKQKVGHPNIAEVRSWQNSLSYMYKVLNDRDVPDVAGVAIEFKLSSSRRVDFIISGRDEMERTMSLIKNKKWEKAPIYARAEGTVKLFGGGIHR